jgi:hypothetical protein
MTTGCSISIDEQMTQLLALQDGWLDGDGTAYDRKVIARVRPIFNLLAANGIPIPFIYPTAAGNISAEWSTPSHEISLVFDRDVVTAHLIAITDRGRYAVNERYQVVDLGEPTHGLIPKLRELLVEAVKQP